MEGFGGMSIQMWLSRGEDLFLQTKLQRQVWDELKWEPMLDVANIWVEVADGVVTLAGMVPSYPAKVAAERAVQRVSGVRAVRNDIEVELPASQVRSDSALAKAAVRALEWDVLVPHEKITIQVVEGRVTLAGAVTRDYERAAAAEAVTHLVGIRGVVNLVTVKAKSSVADLKGRIEAALRHTAGTHGRHIKVETYGDTVVLHGSVRSLAEREEAEHAVWTVPGVGRIEDDVEIGR